MRYSTMKDIRNHISDSFCELDLKCYSENMSDLLDIAARKYRDYLLDKFDYRWGDVVPENDICFYDLIDEFVI